MMDEIEELWALAEECREWSHNTGTHSIGSHSDLQIEEEFRRLAQKLDDIGNRLAGRMPT